MNEFRFKARLDHPAVRHERHEPHPQDRQDDRPTCWSRGGGSRGDASPEFERRLELVGLPQDVLDRYPIELSGGMKQRMVMVISTLLEPVAADRRRDHLGARRLHARRPSRRCSSSSGTAARQEHDRDHARPVDPAQIADTIPVMYAGKLAEKAADRRDHQRARAPLHAAADLVAARGRCPVRGQAAGRHPGQPAVAPRPAGGMPLPGPLSPRLRALPTRSRRSWRSNATTSWPAGSRGGSVGPADADARPCLQGLQGRAPSAARSAGRARRQLRRRCRARSSRSSGRAAAARRRSGEMILRLTSVTSGHDHASTARHRRPRPALRTYYRHVQGVFQDPFSSYNPIFKADRVFAMIRDVYFPACRRAEWSDQLEVLAPGRRPEPRPGARQVPAPAQRRPAPAPADRPRAAARHQAPRRRRDHQHARRLHADRRAQPPRRPQSPRASGSCSSPTTCRSATTSASERSSCAVAGSSRWGRRPPSLGSLPTPTPGCCIASVPQLHQKWDRTADEVRSGSGWAPAPGEPCRYHGALLEEEAASPAGGSGLAEIEEGHFVGCVQPNADGTCGGRPTSEG